MNNIIFNKIKNFIQNPIKLFGLGILLLSSILLFCCQFKYPDFFINRELANQIAQTVSPREVADAIKHLINPHYKGYNCLFQIWGWCITLFIFSVSFKINNFKNFKYLTSFTNKYFVYLWFNISYIIGHFFFIIAYMIDIDKYVYNKMADSMSIPFFSIIIYITCIGIIYYSLINFLIFITYNTKIKRIFYQILWAFIFYRLSILAISSFSMKFTFIHIILDLYYFITFIFIIYAFRFIKNKI